MVENDREELATVEIALDAMLLELLLHAEIEDGINDARECSNSEVTKCPRAIAEPSLWIKQEQMRENK